MAKAILNLIYIGKDDMNIFYSSVSTISTHRRYAETQLEKFYAVGGIVKLFTLMLVLIASVHATPNPEDTTPKPADRFGADRFGADRFGAVSVPPNHAIWNHIDTYPSQNLALMLGGERPDSSGLILRSVDGGRHWSKIVTPNQGRLYDVSLSGNTFFAVGDRGTILTSTDAAQNWTLLRQEEQQQEWFAGVAFVDEKTGFIVGNQNNRAYLLKSEDVGKTWTSHSVLSPDDEVWTFRAVAFRDQQTGLIVGSEGTILISRDGGQRWQKRRTGDEYLRDIAFVGGQDIWVIGNAGLALHSRDDGQTWQPQIIGDKTRKLNAIVFADPNLGWITSMRGEIYETRDGGKTWALVYQTPFQQALTDVSLLAGAGFVVGDQTVIKIDLSK